MQQKLVDWDGVGLSSDRTSACHACERGQKSPGRMPRGLARRDGASGFLPSSQRALENWEENWVGSVDLRLTLLGVRDWAGLWVGTTCSHLQFFGISAGCEWWTAHVERSRKKPFLQWVTKREAEGYFCWHLLLLNTGSWAGAAYLCISEKECLVLLLFLSLVGKKEKLVAASWV